MEILVTGATGMVGSHLVPNLLRRGHGVRFLSTSKSKLNEIPGAKGFLWDLKKNQIDGNALEGVQTIVHLAGATIGKRWTNSYKEEIMRSRVDSAGLLFKAFADNPSALKHFITASGIGIYPDSPSEHYDEHFTGRPVGFAGEVVRNWEAAADAFSNAGIPVAKIRTGLVLARKGGALEQIAKPVRFGLGAALGSGKQIVSWIHLEDLVDLYTLVIDKKLEGIYNAVSPAPVSQAKLTREIAGVLDKPLWLPNIPSFALKLALGEMSSLLLEGQFVESSRIREQGMHFRYPEIRQALTQLLS